MSKSKGNVVSPRELVDEFGADAARSYILYVGHPAEGGDWNDKGIEGIHRFLARLWRAAADAAANTEPSDGPTGEPTAVLRKAHWAIDKVTSDLGERFATHTAIAAVIELVNELTKHRDELVATPEGASQYRFAAATAGSLIFPFAPHLGSEVYELLTGRRVWEEPWPEADPALLETDTVTIVVQLNGKVVDRFDVSAGIADDELEEMARGSAKVGERLDGREIVKAIVVPGRLVNLVAK
jgi:leucyl-tRNA synthetase